MASLYAKPDTNGEFSAAISAFNQAVSSFCKNVLFAFICNTAFSKPASLALLVPPVGNGREYAAATLSPGIVFASPFVIISMISSQSAFDLLVAVASVRAFAVRALACPNAAMC